MKTRKNKVQTDYTLAYLRFLAGFRSSPPAARTFGLTPDEAAEKRAQVAACLNRGVNQNSI